MESIIEKTIINSKDKLTSLKSSLATVYDNKYKNVVVYVCGSLARYEMVESSDLDLFFITNDKKILSSNLNKYTFFSKMYEISKNNNCFYFIFVY